jgi:hypothetical protein
VRFSPKLAWCTLVLLLVPSLAWAGDVTLAQWAEKTVREGLVKPLSQQEGKRFSRERPPPQERRVRVLATAATMDKSGNEFVPFAIDQRYAGGEWNESSIVGCVYRKTGYLFVKIGEEYRPSSFLLGKNVGSVKGVCAAAPPPARS